jgi:hypothetical protein
MPNAMQPSLDKIFTVLEIAKARAQALAQTDPEHDDVLRKFMKDLHQIGIELNNGEYDDTPFRRPAYRRTQKISFLDIFNILGAAIKEAEVIYIEHPAYIFPLKRFQEEITRIGRQLFKNVGRPEYARAID